MKSHLALLAAVLTASCSSTNTTASPSQKDAGISASASIGAKGGVIATNDGTATLTVPAGALGTNTMITITPGTSNVAGAIGQVWEIGPTGTQFSVPVTLTLAYTAAELGGRQAAQLAVGTVVGAAWQPITAASVDTSAHTVSGQTMHLSPYAVTYTVTDAGAQSCSVVVNSLCGGCSSGPCTGALPYAVCVQGVTTAPTMGTPTCATEPSCTCVAARSCSIASAAAPCVGCSSGPCTGALPYASCSPGVSTAPIMGTPACIMPPSCSCVATPDGGTDAGPPLDAGTTVVTTPDAE